MDNMPVVNKLEGKEIDVDQVLRQRAKQFIMYEVVKLLFEKMRMGLGPGEDLPTTEEDMHLIKPRGKKCWFVVFYQGGQRKRWSTRCEKKKDAELVMHNLLKKSLNARNDGVLCNSFSLSDAFAKYLNECSKGIKSSYQRDCYSAKNLLRDLGNCLLEDLNPATVFKWQSRRRKHTMKNGKQVSPRTVNIERSFLHRVLELAVNQWEWISANPARKVPKLSYFGQRNRWYSEEEQRRILEACENLGVPWFADFLKFKWLTGLRRGEILSLKCNQVLLNVSLPLIRLTREKSRIVMDYPLVLPEVKSLLNALCNGRCDEQTLFIDENGNHLTATKVRYWWERVKQAAKLDNARLHDCRHTFATMCYNGGIDDVTIKYLLGQKTLAVTHGYIHPPLRTVADRLNLLSASRQN